MWTIKVILIIFIRFYWRFVTFLISRNNWSVHLIKFTICHSHLHLYKLRVFGPLRYAVEIGEDRTLSGLQKCVICTRNVGSILSYSCKVVSLYTLYYKWIQKNINLQKPKQTPPPPKNPINLSNLRWVADIGLYL